MSCLSFPESEEGWLTMDSEQICHRIMQTLNEFRHSCQHCDITFIVEGIVMPVHRVVMAASSKVFYDILSDKDSCEESHEISGLSAVDMLQVLEFLYSGEINITTENLPNFRNIAEQLDIPLLREICDLEIKKLLEQQTSNVETVHDVDQDTGQQYFIQDLVILDQKASVPDYNTINPPSQLDQLRVNRKQSKLLPNVNKFPENCEFCGKTMSCTQILKTHVNEKHAKDMHRCDFCPLKFGSVGEWEEHHYRCLVTNAHKGNYGYNCTQCRFSATNGATAARHYQIEHAGKEKFFCNECGKTVTGNQFTYYEHLVLKHDIDVTRTDPRVCIHKCDMCDFKTTHHKNIRLHQASHPHYTTIPNRYNKLRQHEHRSNEHDASDDQTADLDEVDLQAQNTAGGQEAVSQAGHVLDNVHDSNCNEALVMHDDGCNEHLQNTAMKMESQMLDRNDANQAVMEQTHDKANSLQSSERIMYEKLSVSEALTLTSDGEPHTSKAVISDSDSDGKTILIHNTEDVDRAGGKLITLMSAGSHMEQVSVHEIASLLQESNDIHDSEKVSLMSGDTEIEHSQMVSLLPVRSEADQRNSISLSQQMTEKMISMRPDDCSVSENQENNMSMLPGDSKNMSNVSMSRGKMISLLTGKSIENRNPSSMQMLSPATNVSDDKTPKNILPVLPGLTKVELSDGKMISIMSVIGKQEKLITIVPIPDRPSTVESIPDSMIPLMPHTTTSKPLTEIPTSDSNSGLQPEKMISLSMTSDNVVDDQSTDSMITLQLSKSSTRTPKDQNSMISLGPSNNSDLEDESTTGMISLTIPHNHDTDQMISLSPMMDNDNSETENDQMSFFDTDDITTVQQANNVLQSPILAADRPIAVPPSPILSPDRGCDLLPSPVLSRNSSSNTLCLPGQVMYSKHSPEAEAESDMDVGNETNHDNNAIKNSSENVDEDLASTSKRSESIGSKRNDGQVEIEHNIHITDSGALHESKLNVECSEDDSGEKENNKNSDRDHQNISENTVESDHGFENRSQNIGRDNKMYMQTEDENNAEYNDVPTERENIVINSTGSSDIGQEKDSCVDQNAGVSHVICSKLSSDGKSKGKTSAESSQAMTYVQHDEMMCENTADIGAPVRSVRYRLRCSTVVTVSVEEKNEDRQREQGSMAEDMAVDLCVDLGEPTRKKKTRSSGSNSNKGKLKIGILAKDGSQVPNVTEQCTLSEDPVPMIIEPNLKRKVELKQKTKAEKPDALIIEPTKCMSITRSKRSAHKETSLPAKKRKLKVKQDGDMTKQSCVNDTNMISQLRSHVSSSKTRKSAYQANKKKDEKQRTQSKKKTINEITAESDKNQVSKIPETVGPANATVTGSQMADNNQTRESGNNGESEIESDGDDDFCMKLEVNVDEDVDNEDNEEECLDYQYREHTERSEIKVDEDADKSKGKTLNCNLKVSSRSRGVINEKCDLCDKQFTKLHSLRQHMIAKHPDQFPKCQFCNEKFTLQRLCENHEDRCRILSQGTVNGRYYCPVKGCGVSGPQTFITRLIRHYRTDHTDRSLMTCTHCGDQINGSIPYYEHLLLKHDVDVTNIDSRVTVWKCTQCDYKTTRSVQFRQHENTHRVYQCTECYKVICSQLNLDAHIQRMHNNSTKMKTYTCDLCTFTTNNKAGVEEHKYKKHGVIVEGRDIYQCSKCTYNSLNLYLIKRHEKETHAAEKMYVCSYCSKTFACKKTLSVHVYNQHIKVKSYPCEMCEFTGPTRKAVVVHVKDTHPDNFPYVCNLCGKRYQIRYSLINHVSHCPRKEKKLWN